MSNNLNSVWTSVATYCNSILKSSCCKNLQSFHVLPKISPRVVSKGGGGSLPHLSKWFFGRDQHLIWDAENFSTSSSLKCLPVSDFGNCMTHQKDILEGWNKSEFWRKKSPPLRVVTQNIDRLWVIKNSFETVETKLWASACNLAHAVNCASTVLARQQFSSVCLSSIFHFRPKRVFGMLVRQKWEQNKRPSECNPSRNARSSRIVTENEFDFVASLVHVENVLTCSS